MENKQIILASALLAILLLTTNTLLAQRQPIKFGKIDKKELEKKFYEIDTSASAIVLCDYGYFNDQDFTFTRILRFKILKREGLSYGNHVFNLREKTNIKGKTYNLENGEIATTKLKNESIFKERVVGRHQRTRIAMPNVKVGSVIDIEFVTKYFPVEWVFQWKIPVLYSELIVPDSPYIQFRKNLFGFEPLKINTSIRWVAEDMPAFKPEPYMNSFRNYITRIEFDILRIDHPLFHKIYTKTWESVSSYLWELSYFGDILRNDLYTKHTISKKLNLVNKTPEEKIKIAFEQVKNIKWDERESLYPINHSVGKAYTEKIGNSADINFALIQLLKSIGIEAYPLVMSSRDNGILSLTHPSINKLNYVIAYVLIDDKSYLLDASEELIPYTLLPMRALNWYGQVILDRRKIQKVDISTNKKDKETVFCNLNLQLSDYSLTGSYNLKRFDYASYNFRKKLENYNSTDEYLDELIKDNPGLRIQDYKIKNIDSIYLPIIESYEVKIDNQVIAIDDELYITPLLYEKIDKNPFNAPKRNYPVDFGYRREKSITIMIKLPENCELIEIPEPISIKMPDNSAYFVYQIILINNMLQLSCKYGLNKAVFSPDEYPTLKNFYSKVIEKMAEPVILKQN